ncbi:acyl-CoA synthetase [Phenylobacterium montanum]|uniref:Acyl-CoA synthetase n=1 Tax=Phenylobacterium montanum TaxID=2823693 RepID=A0A975FW06_9CAUL|nr:acyl-CoA synthetase [Caulobacter sp. S6]QUD86335.1 acyl-CoA synthetase [Caulobacter sp. S6]
MTEWIYADVWEAIADAIPDRPALIHGPRLITWREFDRRADALAAFLIGAGLQRQAKVGAYLFNAPEYLETYYAAFKAGLVPFNTNYRYAADELTYLFDNADAEAIVFHAEYAPMVEAIRERLPGVKAWIGVASPGHPVPAWASDYEAIVAGEVGRTIPSWGRSGDDLLFLYTGGTTGMPKAVMWRQDDLFNVLGAGGNVLLGVPPLETAREAGERARAAEPNLTMAAAPLMHGTSQFTALGSLTAGGAVAVLPSHRFSATELWDEVHRLKVNNMAIVGQAFAAPMLEALEAHPGRWDLSSVRRIGSSGVVWSFENKQGLLQHLPAGAILFDSLGSSEAVGLGASMSAAGETAKTARFVVGPNSAVFTEDGVRVEPGSGEKGLVATAGFVPVGYYKDPEKSARTFRTFEGRRWSVPGDFAIVEADGSMTLLGRGSQVINTGGEKVFPEEVEEALKRHPAVRDAVVVGVPDPRFGERICAVVEAEPSAAPPTLAELSSHVKTQLADYKTPRELVLAPVARAPNGKVDYKASKALAIEALKVAAAG